jgi:hypothetical protein
VNRSKFPFWTKGRGTAGAGPAAAWTTIGPHSSPTPRRAAAHTHPQDEQSTADPEEEEDGPSRLGADAAMVVNCWSLGAAATI